MNFMYQDLEAPQIKLIGFPDRPFYANNNSEVQDKVVIDQAVCIVDSILPQTFGRYGGHYYSFIRRERLLNHILRHYKNVNSLPDQYELEAMLKHVREYHFADRERSKLIKFVPKNGHFWPTLICVLVLLALLRIAFTTDHPLKIHLRKRLTPPVNGQKDTFKESFSVITKSQAAERGRLSNVRQ